MWVPQKYGEGMGLGVLPSKKREGLRLLRIRREELAPRNQSAAHPSIPLPPPCMSLQRRQLSGEENGPKTTSTPPNPHTPSSFSS